MGLLFSAGIFPVVAYKVISLTDELYHLSSCFNTILVCQICFDKSYVCVNIISVLNSQHSYLSFG